MIKSENMKPFVEWLSVVRTKQIIYRMLIGKENLHHIIQFSIVNSIREIHDPDAISYGRMSTWTDTHMDISIYITASLLNSNQLDDSVMYKISCYALNIALHSFEIDWAIPSCINRYTEPDSLLMRKKPAELNL